MLEFLLKYSPVLYEQGQWQWRWHPPVWQLALFAVCLFLFAVFCYYRTTLPLRRGWRYALGALRFLALALIVILLLEPVLSVSTTVPRKSSVLVLVDDSKSMAISDGRATRREQIAARLSGEDGLLDGLAKNFRVETYRFAGDVSPMSGAADLRGEGPSTDLARALEFAGRQAQQGALSGVIMITDGAASNDTDPLPAAATLAAQRVPLFTVGVGEKIRNDVSIAKVEAQRSVLENSAFEVSALLQERGLANRDVTVELRDADGPVQTRQVRLADRSTRLTMQVVPQRKGYVQYTLAVQPVKGESIVDNNDLSFLVNTRDRNARILYVEELHGWEFKFIRRAMDGDNLILLT